MTDAVLLEAHGLTRRYGRHVALRGIDLCLRRGEVLGFLGLNGAGKSTTLQILAGALAPHGGSVHVCGHELTRAPRIARQCLGFLPQTPPLLDDVRVDDYLALCGRMRSLAGAALAAAMTRARALCGLEQVRTRLVRHLSQGYRQRLGLAQAILHEPAVLLLDEPTNGLDPAQIREVRALVGALGREHAVIISSHVLAEVRMLASRIVILHAGRIVHDAPNRGADDDALRLRLAQTVDADTVAALPGVRAVEQLPDGSWLLGGVGGDRAALAAAVVEHGLGLLELARDDLALERLFMQLTAGEAA